MPTKTKLRYLSLFSGIEAWSCAVVSMPEFVPVAFCEIDPFASAVLAHHYPNVPNLGDITKVDWSAYRGSVDLIVGGSPCQGFSVAGLRKGLQDDRSCLALAYVQAVEQIQPRWWIWENVPGALTCNNGEDIKQFFAALNGLGYSISWCILDSQYFSLAQRRRRIFACGHLGGWQNPSKVFFEQSCLQRHPPARRPAREGDPAGTQDGAGNGGVSGTLCASGAGLDRPSASGNQLDYCIVSRERERERERERIAGAVTAKWAKGTGGPAGDECQNLVAQVPFLLGEMGGRQVDGSPCIDCRCHNGAMQNQSALAIMEKSVVRRITPVEAERLQGFPDGWTDIEYNGKPAPDTLRYKCLGNSFSVNVVRWIAERILEVEKEGEDED